MGISRTDIHRSVSVKHHQIRDVPRIFLFDACSGGGDRFITDDSSDEEKGKGDNDGYISMNVGGDVDVNVWDDADAINNPDYKLVLIHAANTGFVAKAHVKYGSYLVYLFVERMMENINGSKGKVLAEIMDDIEEALHSKGKQLPTPLYN